MNKQQADRLIKRAVKAYRQNSASYTSAMDDASVHLSDTQWQQLLDALEGADTMPPLPESMKEEQERLEANVHRLRRELDEAQRLLNAFYAHKHVPVKSRSQS